MFVTMKSYTIQTVSNELEYLRLHGMAHFPIVCRSLVRSLPGNHACVDCNAPNPEWASVTYGCLLCLRCSGRHRSYGVAASVVRSVDMDHWTADQVLAMLEGGNSQLQGFFERHRMGQAMNHKRYQTKAARFYHVHMAEHVATIANQGTYLGREASRQQNCKRKNEGSRHLQSQKMNIRCIENVSKSTSRRLVDTTQ